MLLIQYIKNVCSSFSECGYKHPKVKTGTTLVKCGFKKIVLTKMMSCIRPMPPIPSGTRPMEDQVAGHKFGDGKLGCLQHEDGTLLKPVQCPPKGKREVDFYNDVFDPNCHDKMVLELRRFIPQFFGMVQGSEVCKTSYLKLENLLQDMTKPCVLDIKMGKITYDPEATKEKKAMEIAKYPPLTKLGYQLSGMQIYNPKTKEMEKYDKYYCKKLTENNIVSNGLAKFFCYQGDLSRDLINSVIEQLEQIEEWFSNQRLFAFYASSILIVFDGDNSASTCDIESSNSDNLETNDTSARTLLNSDSRNSVHCSGRNNRDQDNGLLPDSENSCVQSPRVEVRMIDFTHVFPSREEDSNYLFGLRKLICHLRSVIDSPSGLL